MALPIKDFKPNEIKQNQTQSDTDVEKASFVKERFLRMQQARTAVDADWNTYWKMLEAIYRPYEDERSSSVVPLSSAILELFIADCIKIPTEFKFRWETTKYSTQAKALEYVWKYDYRRHNRKKAFRDDDYICGAFGTSVMYVGFESYFREQKDFKIDENLNVVFEPKKIKKEWITVKSVDIRNFYIDDTAIDCIEQANDCIYVEQISYEKFMNYKSNPLYKNMDKVAPQQYSLDYQPYTTTEQTVKQWDFVKIYRYWNVERDMYCEVANDILVREHPMMNTINGEKALPFTIRNLGKRIYSIYWRGMCEALMMFNSEINNLREMLMDAIRRSNTQVLAIGNWLQFDWREFSYDNEILSFDGNFANNFQQIQGNPPNQAIFSYMEQLYRDIAVYVWIDVQNIMWGNNQTAFQTEVQREASQKRINVWLENRDLAYERFADLYKDALQTFFPRKNAEWLYPEIEVEDEELVQKPDGTPYFKKHKWNYVFQVTPEILRGDLYVDVYTNASAPTINAVERQLKLDFMNSIWTMAQWYAAAQQAGIDIDKVLPMNDNIREMAAEYNLSPVEKDDNEEVKRQKLQLLQELQSMQQQVSWTWAYAPTEEEAIPDQTAWPVEWWAVPAENEWDRIRWAVNAGSKWRLVPNLTPNIW